ncbi:unnamed protein product [Rhizoctonia solani]|uniref:F-box domain-containing protein n=1 Tax=Rhizoctonia solani TaxID=456999 RepID=A0A8H3C1T4_9AGAM|nr:unnamed protein product [Rhizoctonia solani]
MNKPPSIIHLPNEVLIRILHYCNYRTIVRFSLTCRNSYEAVLQSVSLQLLMELEVTGLEIFDESLRSSYSSILAELKDHREAWRSFRLAPVVLSPAIVPSTRVNWELRNGAYIGEFCVSNQDYLGDTRIQVIRLDSPVIPPPLAFEKKFNKSVINLSQDLVVLIEYFNESQDPESIIANVHLYHATTGLPHSLAQLSTFKIRDEALQDLPEAHLTVAGSILAITFTQPVYISRYCDTLIWDWKSCLCLGRIKSVSRNANIAFLDKGHLLVFSALPSSSQARNQLALHVYAIPDGSARGQESPQDDVYAPSCPQIEPVLVLEFPKLHKTYQIDGYALASMQLFGDVAYRESAKVVHSRTTTIALQIWTELIEHLVGANDEQPPKEFDYCVFVDTSRIFDRLLENTTGEPVKIPWSQWGPEATRWFIQKDSSSTNSVNAFGSQCPIWDHASDNTGQLLSIFEFNPQVVRQYINSPGDKEKKDIAANSTFSWRNRFGIDDLKAPLMSVGQASMGQHIVTDIVGSDAKTVIDKGFEEPVESSLPYMVVTRVQPIPRHMAWYVQSDCLVGIVGTMDNHIGLI